MRESKRARPERGQLRGAVAEARDDAREGEAGRRLDEAREGGAREGGRLLREALEAQPG